MIMKSYGGDMVGVLVPFFLVCEGGVVYPVLYVSNDLQHYPSQ